MKSWIILGQQSARRDPREPASARRMSTVSLFPLSELSAFIMPRRQLRGDREEFRLLTTAEKKRYLPADSSAGVCLLKTCPGGKKEFIGHIYIHANTK